MFDIMLAGLLIIGVVFWICLRLKNWKQRVIFLLTLFVLIPAAMLYWFQWGWKNREKKLITAQAECRQQMTINELQIIFSGYTEEDLANSGFTIHRNSVGQILDTNQQEVDTTKLSDGRMLANYYYQRPFQVSDQLEISVGKNRYILGNFVLTANANYNMGGAVVSGCRIDSVDINRKRVVFDHNMIIHKSDDY